VVLRAPRFSLLMCIMACMRYLVWHNERSLEGGWGGRLDPCITEVRKRLDDGKSAFACIVIVIVGLSGVHRYLRGG
jgi:hypothetical protein